MSNGQPPPPPLDCGLPKKYTEAITSLGSAPDIQRARYTAQALVRNVAFSKAVAILGGRACPARCPLLSFDVKIGPPQNEVVKDVIVATGPGKSVSFQWDWELDIGCKEIPETLEPKDVQIEDTQTLTCDGGEANASGTASSSDTSETRKDAIAGANTLALQEATFGAQEALQMINCPKECPKKKVEFRTAKAATLVKTEIVWSWPLNFKIQYTSTVFMNWWVRISCVA
jgi:hypothetical protein